MKETLQVKITGDISELKKSVDDAEKEIDDLGKKAKKSSSGVNDLGDSVEQAGKQAKKSSGDIKGMDESLGKASLSALGWSGALTAAIAILGQIEKDTGFFSEALTGLTKEQQASAAAQEKMNDAINKGIGQAQAEIASLNALLGVARDEARTKQERQNAIDQINKEYPGYLGNLNLETVATEETQKAVDALNQSLIRQAKIKGTSDFLALQYAELAKLQTQSLEEAATTTDKVVAFLGSTGNIGTAFGSVLTAGAENIQKGSTELQKQISAAEARLAALLGDQNAYEAPIRAEEERKKLLEKSYKDAQKEAERQKNILEKINKDLSTEEDTEAKENALEVAKIYEESGARIKAALASIEDDPLKIGGEEAFLQIKQIEAALDRIKGKVSEGQFKLIQGYDIDRLKEFEQQLQITEAVSKSVTDGLNDAFAVMAVGMGKSLDEGATGLERFMTSLMQSVVKLLASYLAQSIGAAIAGGASSGASTGPGAIVAIPTMIASLTAAVIGAFAAIPKFAGGGMVGGGSFSGDKVLSYLNSGEMVLNAGQQAKLFAIANGHMGGNDYEGTNTVLEAVIRGQDIYLSNRRAARDNNRFNRG